MMQRKSIAINDWVQSDGTMVDGESMPEISNILQERMAVTNATYKCR